jgi:alpha-beta hydrolase superfamily lysophospholipase
MKVLLNDEAFDGQLLRAVGHMYEGGSDYGECYSTASRIQAHDVESWYKQWNATAIRIETIAKTCLEKNHRISAYETYLRASMYHRCSGQFFIGNPDEKRTLAAFQKTASCFEEAMKLSTNVKCEVVQIPYKDGKHLPGYFITPNPTDKSGQTVIINGGYDSVKEECYFFSGAAALRRGYKVILFDGPGQGIPLLQDKLVTIPDWENVITPVVDYLCTRTDVDKSKIAAMGISLGGYQIPRAATKEKRLAAIIADPAQISIGRKARARLPLPASWKSSFPKGTPGLAVSLIATIMRRMASDPSGGWTLRRTQHVHGFKKIVDMFEELDKYELDPKLVTCPVFVSWAEKDAIASESKEFYEKCGSEKKKFVQYKEVNGSHEHCEAGNRSPFNQDAFDWLEELWA